MQAPLSLSELAFWMAIMCVLLLVTSEFFVSSNNFGSLLNKKRMQQQAFMFGLAFMATVLLRMVMPSLF